MKRGNLDDLADFAVVARLHSFTRAAAELRVSTSALSHAIKALETRIGTRLLQRNSRGVSLTMAGEELLRSLDPALSTIGAALDRLHDGRDAGVRGTVRLTATRHAFESVLRPALPAFLATHPHAGVEVLIDYRLRDIVADRLDAGIRLGDKLEKDTIAVRVGPDLRMAVVASPSYLAAHGMPAAPVDLVAHRCINYRMMASGETYDWEFVERGRAFTIKVDGPLTFNEPETMLEAAIDGLGVAYVVEALAAGPIAAGRLVRLLEGWTAPFGGYHLYYASRRQPTPVLGALIAALRERAPPP